MLAVDAHVGARGKWAATRESAERRLSFTKKRNNQRTNVYTNG